ncbi:MAG TPA: cytochrome P460 family protein [Flavobacteriales bacterium]|nr:cytochrome P460 family protein [Flavobacteriales bacterium]
MRTSIKATGIIILSSMTLGWVQNATSSEQSPSVKEIASNYQTYEQITKGAVDVDPRLYQLCTGAKKQPAAVIVPRDGPHAHSSIMIYMNRPAAKTFSKSRAPYPVGSVIVKQKAYHDPAHGATLFYNTGNGVGGMVKRAPGYDAANGDWEYFYYQDTAEIESGRITSCVQCHSSARDKDYVFGTWRSATR